LRHEYVFFPPPSLSFQPTSVMRAVVIFVLSFVASTLGYMVIFPNGDDGTGWTTQGPQLVNWTFVSTDPPNFVLNLTNQQMFGFVPMTLVNEVTGSTGSIEVNPPSGGFKPGSNYRIDFVTSPEDPNDSGGILAQSNQFNITGPGSSSASGTGSGTTGTTSYIQYGSTGTSGLSGTAGVSDSSGSSGTDTGLLPTSSSAASSRYPIQTNLLVLFSFLGFTLA